MYLLSIVVTDELSHLHSPLPLSVYPKSLGPEDYRRIRLKKGEQERGRAEEKGLSKSANRQTGLKHKAVTKDRDPRPLGCELTMCVWDGLIQHSLHTCPPPRVATLAKHHLYLNKVMITYMIFYLVIKNTSCGWPYFINEKFQIQINDWVRITVLHDLFFFLQGQYS